MEILQPLLVFIPSPDTSNHQSSQREEPWHCRPEQRNNHLVLSYFPLLLPKIQSLATFSFLLIRTCCESLMMEPSSVFIPSSSNINQTSHWPLPGERGIFTCCPCTLLNESVVEQVWTCSQHPGSGTNNCWQYFGNMQGTIRSSTAGHKWSLTFSSKLFLCPFLIWEVLILSGVCSVSTGESL